MADSNSAHEGSVRTYLANHGGSVEDAGGRGLTDEMARELGVEKPAVLSAILGQMETDGVITQDRRGLRTYRIALAVPEGAMAGADNGGRIRTDLRGGRKVSLGEAPVTEPAPVEPSRQPGAGAVTLREALSRKAVPAPPEPAVATPEPVPAAADQAPAKAVSLRDAISRQATSVPSPTPAAAALSAPAGLRARPVSRVMPDPEPDSDATPARAVSLRDALSRSSGDEPWAPSGPSGAVSTARDTTWLAPVPDIAPTGKGAKKGSAKKAGKGGRSRPARSRPRLSVPVPEVRSAPSSTIVTAVGLAVAGLVLVAVITVVVAKGSNHHVAAQAIDPSTDACSIVTPAMASVAFGDNAGTPHFVLGECVYDDSTHELLAEVFNQDAKTVFDASHTSSALDVPGLGDSAYYVDGRLRVLAGNNMLEIALGPVPAATPAPSVLALARAALANL